MGLSIRASVPLATHLQPSVRSNSALLKLFWRFPPQHYCWWQHQYKRESWSNLKVVHTPTILSHTGATCRFQILHQPRTLTRTFFFFFAMRSRVFLVPLPPWCVSCEDTNVYTKHRSGADRAKTMKTGEREREKKKKSHETLSDKHPQNKPGLPPPHNQCYRQY